MRKQINMQILIVTMLIITIISVVSTVIMYKLFMDTRDTSNISVSNNSNDKVEEEHTTENTFAAYQKNYQQTLKEIKGKENEISIYLGKNRAYELPGVERVYVDVNNNAYFEFTEGSKLYAKYGETLKVESGVANVFVYPVGSGGYSEAIFLKLDGTVSTVNGYYLENDETVEIEDIEGAENVINVINYFKCYYNENGEYEGSTPTTVYIDINGNVIK